MDNNSDDNPELNGDAPDLPRVRRLKLSGAKLFAAGPGDFVVVVSDLDSPASGEDTAICIEVRDGRGEIRWGMETVLRAPAHRIEITLPSELALEPGRYTFAASPVGDELFVVRDFIITGPTFGRAADNFKYALLFHAEAMEAARAKRFLNVLAPLLRSAELFVEANSVECAISA